jgi:hypothetical protein
MGEEWTRQNDQQAAWTRVVTYPGEMIRCKVRRIGFTSVPDI